MENSFDVIIVGAGPAGLNAALHILKNKSKPSVLLLDKITPWETQIACAEGVWYGPFTDAIRLQAEWIRTYISKAVLHSPDGTVITYFDKNKGCIINRAIMQRDMAEACVNAGAVVRLNCKVMHIDKVKDCNREIRLADGSTVIGRVVIDASGPVSGFGRDEKISWKPIDLEPAYFAVAENTGIETDAIHIFIGKQVAPGGYAWAFPRGTNIANVGIVMGKRFLGQANIRRLLDVFLSRDFPRAKVLRYFAGSIPCETGKTIMAVDRFFKAGDAASSINPISRAGITEALVGGGLAGDFAMKMLAVKSKKQSISVCKAYRDAWLRKMGKAHLKLARVKESLYKIPDGDYNQAFRMLLDIPKNKLAMSKIITLSLGRFPRLVWAFRHLL